MNAGRPLTLAGPLSPLCRLLGKEGLCEALGNVDPSTIWRWDTGAAVPNRSAQALISDVFRANGLEPHKWPKRTRNKPASKAKEQK